MRFNVKFKEHDKRISVKFEEHNKRIDASFSHYQIATKLPEGFGFYEGEYDITPKIEQQVLATNQKFMRDDVVIKEIPYYSTNNEAGGDTVYIGNEVD